VLLFLHGIRNDDSTALWRTVLDAALSREGVPSLEERGYLVVGPSYVDILDAETVPPTEPPSMTYVKGDEEAYRRAAGAYWASLAEMGEGAMVAGDHKCAAADGGMAAPVTR
jgi:hypothetical protein